MNKFVNRIYNGTFTTLKYIILFMSLLLFLTALFFTSYIDDMTTQTMLLKVDNLFFSSVGIVVFLSILYVILHLLRHRAPKYKKYILFLVLLWYIAAGCVLVLFSRSAPAADPKSVYDIAAALAAGNTGVIHPTDSYLSYYPHQIGLVAYYEIVLRVWNLLPVGLAGFHVLKLLNVFWACVIILFQYKTLELLFDNDTVQITYLLLMLCNLPLLIYTSFVYGEIPSFACFSIGVWALLKVFATLQRNTSFKSNRAYLLYTILSCIGFTLSIMMRKNALILIIAVIGVTLFEILHHKRVKLLINIIIYTLIGCFTLTIVQGCYEHRAGNSLSTGVTPLSYFAMGMQESSRGEGWYNGFNFYTYQESGLNTEVANQVSRQAIEERFSYFKEHPNEMLAFYINKFRIQWCDGTYASLQATQNEAGGRIAFFTKLYNGTFDGFFIAFCNLMQTILYLGSLVFAILQTRNKNSNHPLFHGFPLYICIIGTFGGLLFHMLWEAGSRYIFPYSLLLYPYAAYGLTILPKHLSPKTKTEAL